MIRVFAKRDLPVMDIIELQGRIVITPEALAEAQAVKKLRRAARQQKKEAGAEDPKDDSVLNTYYPSSARAAGEKDSASYLSKATSGKSGTALPSLTLTTPYSSSSGSSDDEFSDSGDEAIDRDSSRVRHELRRSSADDALDTCVVEVPLGHVEQDQLSEKRCTLCIDTLRVDGSRSTFKHPLLVLKECSPARVQQLRQHFLQRLQKEKQIDIELSGGDNKSSSAADATCGSTVLFSEWLQLHPNTLSLDSLYLNDFVEDEKGFADSLSESNADDASSLTRKRLREDKEKDDQAAERVKSSFSLASTTPSPHSSTTAMYKNYELVGVVRSSVLFNSKPARVFK